MYKTSLTNNLSCMMANVNSYCCCAQLYNENFSASNGSVPRTNDAAASRRCLQRTRLGSRDGDYPFSGTEQSLNRQRARSLNHAMNTRWRQAVVDSHVVQ